MEHCDCGREPEHHPSLHFAEKRDALMVEIDKFMVETYPENIFGKLFNRKQVSLIAACFIVEREGR